MNKEIVNTCIWFGLIIEALGLVMTFNEMGIFPITIIFIGFFIFLFGLIMRLRSKT